MALPKIGLPTLTFFSSGLRFQQRMNFCSRFVPPKDGPACVFNVVHFLILLFSFSTYQFEDIGTHGTKVMIYNLWLNDEGIYELSFDEEDEVLTLSFSDQVFCRNWVLNVFNISSFVLGVIGHTAPRSECPRRETGLRYCDIRTKISYFLPLSTFSKGNSSEYPLTICFLPVAQGCLKTDLFF